MSHLRGKAKDHYYVFVALVMLLQTILMIEKMTTANTTYFGHAGRDG